MFKGVASVISHVAISASLLLALLPGLAHANPAWLFNGTELSGQETVVGDAVLGSFTSSAISVVCKKTLYEMDISNKGKVGQASMNSLSFSTCTATSPCTVEEIGAEALPWPSSLKMVSGNPYFVVEKIKIQVLFGNPGCALYETWMTISGTATALYDNPTETFAFNPAKLVAFGQKIDWTAAFTTEAEFRKGEALTAG